MFFAHQAERAIGYPVLATSIKTGCRLAIWLSERIQVRVSSQFVTKQINVRIACRRPQFDSSCPLHRGGQWEPDVMDDADALQIVLVTGESGWRLRRRLRRVCAAGWRVQRLWRFGLPLRRRFLVTLVRPEDLGHVLNCAA